MQIAVLNGATPSLTNKELETGVHKLRFAFSGIGAQSAEVLTPDAAAIFAALIGDTKISLSRQDATNTVTLMQTLLLREIAEASTFHEGVITITRKYDNAVANNNTIDVEFSVEISEEAFKGDDGQKVILNLEGKPANVSCTIDAIDHPENSTRVIKYENKYLNANVSKDFPCDGHYAAALPISKITSLELRYRNGKTVKMSQSEVRQTILDGQDPVYNINGKVAFIGTIGVVSLVGVYEIGVTLTDNSNIYLMRTLAY